MSKYIKTCSRCKNIKDLELDFYKCQGKYRSECKACTIKKNVIYQRKEKSWMRRFVDENEQRSYMVDYYSKNKEKFAEYRRRFKEKHPDKRKEYARKYKEQKNSRNVKKTEEIE